MSIASELSALNGYILGAYDEINGKGGTVPANKNMANLASAISSISSGTPTTITPLSVTENGTYTAPTGTAYSPVTVNVSASPQILGYSVESGEFSFNSVQTTSYTVVTGVKYADVKRSMMFIYWWTPNNINDYGYVGTTSNAFGLYVGGYIHSTEYRPSSGTLLSADSSASASPQFTSGANGYASFILPAKSNRRFVTGATYKWVWLYDPK